LRVQNRETLDATVGALLLEMSMEEAVSRMSEAKVAYASVNTVEELSTHPHLRRIKVDTPEGEVQMVSPPAQVREQTRSYGPVPALGQHTDTIRKEFSA